MVRGHMNLKQFCDRSSTAFETLDVRDGNNNRSISLSLSLYLFWSQSLRHAPVVTWSCLLKRLEQLYNIIVTGSLGRCTFAHIWTGAPWPTVDKIPNPKNQKRNRFLFRQFARPCRVRNKKPREGERPVDLGGGLTDWLAVCLSELGASSLRH